MPPKKGYRGVRKLTKAKPKPKRTAKAQSTKTKNGAKKFTMKG